MKIKMPDGKIVKVADNLSQSQIEEVVEDYNSRLPQQAQPQVNKAQDLLNDVRPALKATFPLLQVPGVQQALTSQPVKAVGGAVLKGVEKFGTLIDRFGGAPTRAAITEYGQRQQEPVMSQLGGALGAFTSNFGLADPTLAPTGRQAAQSLGASNIPLSERFPSLYSESGKGLPLKKGSYLDISPEDVSATAITMVDPTMAFGGELLGLPKALGRGGVKASGFVAEKALGSAKMAEAKAFGGAFKEKAVELKDLIVGKDAKIAPTFEKQFNVAKRNGIDPELLNAPIKYGKESSLSKYEKSLAEGVGGISDEIVNNNTKLHTQIQSAIDKNVKAISGKGYQSKEMAAEALRNKFSQNISDEMAKVESRYESALDYMGKPVYKTSALQSKPYLAKPKTIPISKTDRAPLEGVLNAIEASTKKQMNVVAPGKRGAFESVLEDVQAIKKSATNYEDLLTSLRMTGKKAFTTQNMFDYNDLQKIYGGMSETLLNAVKDPALKSSIQESNSRLSEIFKARDRLKPVLGNENLSPIEAFDKVFKTGSATQIDALKKIYSAEDLAKFKAAALRDLLDPILRDLTQESGKEIASGYRTILSNLYRNRDRYRSLFSPGELKNITDLLNIGDKAGVPYMSSSRTSTQTALQGSALDKILSPVNTALGVVPNALRRKELTKAEQKLQQTLGGNKPRSGFLSALPSLKTPLKAQAVRQGARQYNLSQQEENR